MRNSYNSRSGEALVRDHRAAVGGKWDELGSLQLNLLISEGMRPEHYLLDIGCGSLRLGVKAAAYLEPGRYFGTDLSPDLLKAGWEREVRPRGLDAKLPWENLAVDSEFDIPLRRKAFEFLIAQSLFTHIDWSLIRLCFLKLDHILIGPSSFYFTYFEVPEDVDISSPREQLGGIVTFPARDPVHYRWADLVHATSGTQWTLERIGDWGHPRGQMLGRARREA